MNQAPPQRPPVRLQLGKQVRQAWLRGTPGDVRRQRTVLWLAIIIVIGLSLRSYHYLINPPVWHDEAAQIYNVLHKDYSALLGPLYYSEACPPLFLALEKVVVMLLGDGTYALRLLPFVASCVALVALVMLARTILPRASLLCFTVLVACSDRLLWHASEAKPYALDVLVAAGVLAVGLRLQKAHAAGDAWRWLIVAAVFSPLLIFLSFPACFLLGGLALSVLPDVWRWRRPGTWLAYLGFCTALGCSFLLLYTTAIQAQKNERMISCWVDKFPAWDEPWLVPVMAIVRLTELCRYALEPAGNVLCPLAVIGSVVLWRSGSRRLVALLLLPITLNVIAWLNTSYPLEASRVVVYAAPAILLLMAAGIPPSFAWLRQRGRWAPLGLAALLLIPIGQVFWVFHKPWARLDSATPVAFVLEHREATEPVFGTLWEQTYYCRHLGPLYQTLVEQPTEPHTLRHDGTSTEDSVQSLWLLTSHDVEEQASEIAKLQPAGPWRIVETHPFRDVVVLRLRR